MNKAIRVISPLAREPGLLELQYGGTLSDPQIDPRLDVQPGGSEPAAAAEARCAALAGG